MCDVHNHDPLQLYNETKNAIETKRRKYEHECKIIDLNKTIDKVNESKTEETDDDNYIDQHTTTKEERQTHNVEAGATFDKQAAIRNLHKEKQS